MINHIESLKKRLDYSLLQFVDADSASISIGAVLAFYGFHADLTSLQDVCATSKQFPSVEALLRAVEHFNLDAVNPRIAEDYRNSNHHIKLSLTPSLILEESGKVVACFDSYNNNLLIYDPAQGIKEIPRNQVEVQEDKSEHEEKPKGIPIKKNKDGEIIANAFVTPEQVSIILNDGIGLTDEIPPLRSFFIERIIGEMKKTDSVDVKDGKIDQNSVIDCVINKNGPSIREIIIKNYRQKERLDEIINTATWSLTRMLENSVK